MNGLRVSVGVDGGGGGKNEDVASGVGGEGCLNAGRDDADDGNGPGCRAYLIEGKGGLRCCRR